MWILTAVGPDSPGMAHAVAQILFEHGCNIEDTTMTRLSGHFSMLFAVEPPQNLAISTLQNALAPLQNARGLVADVLNVEPVSDAPHESPRAILTAYGAEKTGLLARLTGELAAQNVNVTDVQTRVASAGSVYIMILEIEVPATLQNADLEAKLRQKLPDLQIGVRALETETL